MSGEQQPNQIDWRAALADNQRWLRTIVLARLRDREAADDVMQEVALAAVKQSAPLRDPGKVSAWLYRLAIRQVLLFRRKCGRQRNLLGRFVQANPYHADEAIDADPLDWLLANERKQQIRLAMKQLPTRDAEILLLKYTQGWSYGEIAKHLGVSKTTVESRLHRARARLRRRLAPVLTAGAEE